MSNIDVSKLVPIFDEADPRNYPLTARQLRLGLIRHGISLSVVQAAIDGLPSPNRDEAQVYWEFSTEIHWGHPMTGYLVQLIGLGLEDAATMWLTAKDYER